MYEEKVSIESRIGTGLSPPIHALVSSVAVLQFGWDLHPRKYGRDSLWQDAKDTKLSKAQRCLCDVEGMARKLTQEYDRKCVLYNVHGASH